MDKKNKVTRPLGSRRQTRPASRVDNKAQSDDSSSNSKYVGVSSIYHSDSDDINSDSQFAVLSTHRMHLESDSVDENLTPGRQFNRRIRKSFFDKNMQKQSSRRRRRVKKKIRKSKKKIIDLDVKFSPQMTSSCYDSGSSEKRRTNRYSAYMPRKRSKRGIILGNQGTSNNKSMDIDVASSSTSMSSLETEGGIFTDDEGREGDDEQSEIGLVVHEKLVG